MMWALAIGSVLSVIGVLGMAWVLIETRIYCANTPAAIFFLAIFTVILVVGLLTDSAIGFMYLGKHLL